MKVSVIVVSRNEVERISSCIDSVLFQTYKDYELIVVDGGSTDGTLEIVKSYVHENPEKIRLILDQGRGAGPARNLGVKAASGEVLTVIDADDEVNSEYLETVARHFEDSRVAGVFVKMTFYTSGPKIWGKIQDAWKWMRWSKEVTRFPVAFRKEVFEAVEGYGSKFVIGEDYTLYRKIKNYVKDNSLKFETEKKAVIYMVSEDTPSKIFKHGIWFGKNLMLLVKQQPKFGGSILGWSLCNAFAPLCIPFLIFSTPLWWFAIVYITTYLALWLFLIAKAAFTRHRPHSMRHIFLTPILQVIVGLGITVGILHSFAKLFKS